jgi:hypothetical protein
MCKKNRRIPALCAGTWLLAESRWVTLAPTTLSRESDLTLRTFSRNALSPADRSYIRLCEVDIFLAPDLSLFGETLLRRLRDADAVVLSQQF